MSIDKERTGGSQWPELVFETLKRWEPVGLIVMSDGARLIGRVPQVAELAYLHRVPAPLSSNEIDGLEKAIGVEFPRDIRVFYLAANGLSIYSDALNVYGLRRSYQRSDALAASSQPFCYSNKRRGSSSRSSCYFPV